MKVPCPCCRSHGSSSSFSESQGETLSSSPTSKKSVTFLLYHPNTLSSSKHKNFSLFAPGSSKGVTPSPKLLNTLFDRTNSNSILSQSQMKSEGSFCDKMAKTTSHRSHSKGNAKEDNPDASTHTSHKSKRSESKAPQKKHTRKSASRSESKIQIRHYVDEPCDLPPNSHFDPGRNILHVYDREKRAKTKSHSHKCHHGCKASIADGRSRVADLPSRSRYMSDATGVMRDSRNRGRTCSYHLRKTIQNAAGKDETDTATQDNSQPSKTRSKLRQRSTILSRHHHRIVSQTGSRNTSSKPYCPLHQRELLSASRLRSPSVSSEFESTGDQKTDRSVSSASSFRLSKPYRRKERNIDPQNIEFKNKTDKPKHHRRKCKKCSRHNSPGKSEETPTTSDNSQVSNVASTSSSAGYESHISTGTQIKYGCEFCHFPRSDESIMDSRSPSPNLIRPDLRKSAERAPLPGAWRNWDADYTNHKKTTKEKDKGPGSHESRKKSWHYHSCCHFHRTSSDQDTDTKSRSRSRTRDIDENPEEKVDEGCCADDSSSCVQNLKEAKKKLDGSRHEKKEHRKKEKHSRDKGRKDDGHSGKHRHCSRARVSCDDASLSDCEMWVTCCRLDDWVKEQSQWVDDKGKKKSQLH